MRYISPIILLFCFFLTVIYAEVKVDVVYPRPTETNEIPVIDDVDSNFVFGSVYPADSPVYVNGIAADVYSNGAFIAFVPLDNERMKFEIIAGRMDDFIILNVPYKFFEPIEPAAIDCLLPIELQIVEDHSVMRYSGNYGVYYYFPVRGAKIYADSVDKNFFRIKLAEDRFGWIEDRFVAPIMESAYRSPERIYSLDVVENEDHAEIIVACRNFPVHRVVEHSETSSLSLYLYGIESHIDIIKYQSDYVQEIRWEQVEPGILQLLIFLDSPFIQGYDADTDSSGGFRFTISKPREISSLKDIRICLDPGHGGESFGAIGPTRVAEKDINLQLALKTADLLKKKGAQVMLTRSEDSAVELYDRMDMGYEWGADLFVSLHANALSDGKNPKDYSGFGVYYYHPKSHEFAKTIYKELGKIDDLSEDGLYYDNLAVPRATYFPSILIETGYIIKPEEEMLLTDEKFQRKVAAAIYKGVKQYIKSLKKLNEEYFE